MSVPKNMTRKATKDLTIVLLKTWTFNSGHLYSLSFSLCFTLSSSFVIVLFISLQNKTCDHLGDDLRCHLKVIHAAGKMLNKLKPTDGEKITQDHVSSQEGGQGWQV